jgi:hypothetical protein
LSSAPSRFDPGSFRRESRELGRATLTKRCGFRRSQLDLNPSAQSAGQEDRNARPRDTCARSAGAGET